MAQVTIAERDSVLSTQKVSIYLIVKCSPHLQIPKTMDQGNTAPPPFSEKSEILKTTTTGGLNSPQIKKCCLCMSENVLKLAFAGQAAADAGSHS